MHSRALLIFPSVAVTHVLCNVSAQLMFSKGLDLDTEFGPQLYCTLFYALREVNPF
jgi:hypothetical protein